MRKLKKTNAQLAYAGQSICNMPEKPEASSRSTRFLRMHEACILVSPRGYLLLIPATRAKEALKSFVDKIGPNTEETVLTGESTTAVVVVATHKRDT
jgi:hypothetical protein